MALVQHPTPLMMALSEAVLNLDPSVPAPQSGLDSSLAANADHWDAVACYAEAFPTALAKRVEAQGEPLEASLPAAIEGLGERVQVEARDIRDTLADPGLAGGH
jgi:hypothetical protein